MIPEKKVYVLSEFDINPEYICPYHPCKQKTEPNRCFGNYTSCFIYQRSQTLSPRENYNQIKLSGIELTVKKIKK